MFQDLCRLEFLWFFAERYISLPKLPFLSHNGAAECLCLTGRLWRFEKRRRDFT
jgi:hypothetical protein